MALLRESGDVTLADLRDLLTAAPELRRMTLTELFEAPSTLARPAPAPLSAAAKVSAYLLDQATTAGRRERGGLLVRVPSLTKIAEQVGARDDSVALTVSLLERRGLIAVRPRRILVRDRRGLALLAGRPLPRSRPRRT
ncbi:helix-turn-helix domain-containing protein [Nannocystis exedens]|uniref:helix-turn-helix domain-containing protein n=1 Tax=Nannocystis exedens TaxID=54 RepID=UPI00116061D7|nr:helix-turn-helix domain-containing protein [Nannocystis exedens]